MSIVGKVQQTLTGSGTVARLLNMSLTVGSAILSQLGVVVVIARFFGVEGMGVYAYHFAIASLFGLVSTFGFPIYLQRELASRDNDFTQVHYQALSLKIVIDSVLLVLGLLVVALFPIPQVGLFLVFFASRIAFAYSSFLLVEFRVMKAFQVESSLTALFNLFYFFGALLSAWCTHDILYVGIALLVVRLAGVFVSGVVWKRMRREPLLVFAKSGLGKTLRKNLPYSLDQGLTEFLMHSISLVIGLKLGDAALGLYQAGMRFVSGLLTFASVVMGAFLSKMTEAWSLGKRAFIFELRNASGCLLFVGTLGAGFLFLFGDRLTLWFLGDDFLAINDLWALFAAYLILRYLSACPGIALVAAGKQRSRVAVNAVAGLSIVGFLTVSMDHLGLQGALIAMVISVCFTLVLYSFIVFRSKILYVGKL